jgi:hypothetical protein
MLRTTNNDLLSKLRCLFSSTDSNINCIFVLYILNQLYHILTCNFWRFLRTHSAYLEYIVISTSRAYRLSLRNFSTLFATMKQHVCCLVFDILVLYLLLLNSPLSAKLVASENETMYHMKSSLQLPSAQTDNPCLWGVNSYDGAGYSILCSDGEMQYVTAM